MTTIEVGSEVIIPCEVKPGPFSSENFVSFQTNDGPVSGFIKAGDLIQKGSEWFLTGLVKNVEDDSLTVLVRGSFFTTNGIASVSKEMATAA